MVHNTAGKASEVFEAETAFAVEDFLFDLYYWFDKSREKNKLSDFFNNEGMLLIVLFFNLTSYHQMKVRQDFST